MDDISATRQREKAALLALRKREWVVLSVFLALALLVAFNIKRVEVNGISMEPAYLNGDTVIVWKTAPRQALKPGDVIVFKSSDGDELIKRIVFVGNAQGKAQFPPPGFPRVLTTPAGVRILPDAPPEMTFEGYFGAVETGRLAAPPPQNTIYVMGDNVLHSNDSRDFGPISPSQILGKVLP